MISMDSYLNAYVDRRMKSIVEEWDLSTRQDLDDLTDRLDTLEREVPLLKVSEQKSSAKLTELEARARRLKGRA
jgi:hypothetical protein